MSNQPTLISLGLGESQPIEVHDLGDGLYAYVEYGKVRRHVRRADKNGWIKFKSCFYLNVNDWRLISRGFGRLVFTDCRIGAK